MNENWPRWIFASLTNHFYDLRQGLNMYIEGQHQDDIDAKDGLELRIDGPNITELSKDYWHLYMEINILVKSAMDDDNFHRIYTDVGIVSAAFTNIEIFRKGDSTSDDGTLLGCMRLVQSAREKEKIQISHFGRIGPDTKLLQATVEGHYEMFLDT